MIHQTDGKNPADICKLCMHIKRKAVMTDSPVDLITIEESCSGRFANRNEKIKICKMIKKAFPHLSGRDIARITRISVTSVSRYLSEGGNY